MAVLLIYPLASIAPIRAGVESQPPSPLALRVGEKVSFLQIILIAKFEAPN
jgi:hypothetical protein